MGYQALLFCPDEKTARTVTQVLNELEFNVESCIEPFAAVKKLMGQHFDAVVVDCDNEQNATLLFKSARNSTSNQTSLAVAVVEGQAGVAKAFRIGANLVLTKPINIEQAKGTLRVARGLLRKSDPTKAAATSAPATAPVPAAPRPAPPKPVAAAKPPAPVAPPPAPPTWTADIPATKPQSAPAGPSAAIASANPADPDADLLEIDVDEPAMPLPKVPTATVKPVEILASIPETLSPQAPKAPVKPSAPPSFSLPTSGAASAPAPARVPELAPEAPKSQAPTPVAIPEKHAEIAPGAAPVVGSAPSFTFGGANAEPEASGGNKKILIGVAAVIIAAVAYVGWSRSQSHEAAQPPTPVAVAPATFAPRPAKPSSVPPTTTASTTAPAPSVPASAHEPSSNSSVDDSDFPDDVTVRTNPTSTKTSGAASTPSTKTSAAAVPEPAPMVVKGGKGPATQAKASAPDAPAPSLIGMSTPSESVPPPNFGTTGSSVKPVLQTLIVSQGVSQGLLIKKVAPSYPANATRMRIEGSVELLATVSKDGNITRIKVISGDPQLTKAATDAVKQWKYKPYQLNNEPVEITTQVTINFRLPK